MTPAAIRLAAFDIDGTLVDSDKQLRPRTRDAVRRLVRSGVHVVLATGRIHPSAAEIALALEIDAGIVSQNGSHVRLGGDRRLHSRPLSAPDVGRVLDVADGFDAIPFLFLEETIVVRSDRARERRPLDRWTGGRHYAFAGDLRAVGDPVLQIHLIAGPEAGPSIHDGFAAALGGAFDLFGYFNGPRDRYHLEVRSPGEDKGTGVEHIRRALGVERHEVLAAGDWLNDVPLLAAAGVAVAMRGAPAALLDRAHHVAPGTSDEDGLAAFLEDWLGI